MRAIPKKYILLHGIVMCYLILAFSWWAILLYKKNEEVVSLRTQLSAYDTSLDIGEINKKYKKQRNMILSEGLVFGLSILLGLLLIYRSFRKELQLNRQQNDFLLSVTHELKTPIATLKLVNKTLKRKDLPDSKRASLLESGWEESLRLESQVNNLLTAAQIEQAYVYNFQDTNLDLLLQDLVKRYQRVYTGHAIRYNGPASSHSKIDKEAFTKAIDNLVSNACKYSKEGSEVIIELNNNKSGTTITIADTGSGIPDMERQKIWEKFYRVGTEETRETQGTGLGLWIVQSVIEAHKGKVTVSANSPEGSIFTIDLPSS